MSLDSPSNVNVLVSLLIALGIAMGTYIVSQSIRRHFEKRAAEDRRREAFYGTALGLIRLLLYSAAFVIMFILVLVPLGLVPDPVEAVSEFFRTQSPVIVLAIGTVIVGWIALRFVGVVFEGIRASGRFNARVVDLMSTVTSLVIYSVTGVILIQILLSALGMKEVAGSVVTLFAAFIGIAVSFAATGSLGNFLAGMLLMSWQPFKSGDRVELGGGVYGDLLEHTLTHVRIRTIKDEIVTVPNLQVIANKIVNYSAMPLVILHTNVTVGYDVPRQAVEEALLDAAGETWGVDKTHNKPFVLVRSLDQYYVTYELNGYTDKPNKMVEISSELHKRILDSFERKGIEIVSPLELRIRGQRDDRS